MDFENYKVFLWTDRQLKKHHSQKTLDKYYKILAYLYQNGFDVNCSEEEVDEQLAMYNFFEKPEDLQELRDVCGIKSDYETGKKIYLEELYDIVKTNAYSRQTSENPAIIKTYAQANWDAIKKAIERFESVYFSEDSEIVGAMKSIASKEQIKKKITDVKKAIEREIKVLTWILFTDIINSSYSIYITNSKTKTDVHKLSIASNFNDELYGGVGGYNPNSGEIKCIIGSAVYDVKSCYSSKTMTKVKSLANTIFKENTKVEEDDEGINFLQRWLEGKEKDDEYAKRAVITSCLWGIMNLLILKHNVNFLDDKKNAERSDKVMKEFHDILKFCGIQKEYLL